MPSSSLFSWLCHRLPIAMLAVITWQQGSSASAAVPLSPPRDSLQAIVVIADDWKSTTATLQRFARANPQAPWTAEGNSVAVTLGSAGLGWGLGLHQLSNDQSAPQKVEGDRRAPAGMFHLREAFGTLPVQELAGRKWPYQKITPTLEAIDDPRSRYYNQIVDRAKIPRPDWSSSEKMAAIPVYELGLVVAHNPECLPGRGSCIFIHLKSPRGTSTVGCTALSPTDLRSLLLWLDPARRPVLIQLPRAVAEQKLPEFALPKPQ